MRFRKGLAEKSLLKRIGLFNRLCGVGERGLGFYLLDFSDRGLYRKFGFSSTAQFALMRFQISPRKTREVLRIARALEELPLIDEAFADGRVSWSAVRELSRVATRETEKDWLGFAQRSTMRQVECAVSRARRGERPPRDAYGLTRTKLKVVAELFLEDHAVWQAAFDRVAAGRGGEMDASTALLVLAKSYLEKPLDRVETGARKAFQVVYHRCGACGRAWIETGDGPAGVPADLVAARENEAEVIRLEEEKGNVATATAGTMAKAGMAAAAGRAGAVAKKKGSGPGTAGGSKAGGAQRGWPPGWTGTDRVDPRGARGARVSTPESPAVPKEKRDKANTPSLRRRVLGRDGQCCAVPGCPNRGRLVSHHVLWRSHGGATEMENEIAICQSCHSLIHEGLIRVTGRSPEGLLWLDGEGNPLEQGFEAWARHGGEKQYERGILKLLYTTEARGSREGGREDAATPAGHDPRGSSRREFRPGLSDPRGAPPDVFSEKDTIYSMDEVPGEIDAAWWRRFGHNFVFQGNRLLLRRAVAV